MCMTVVSVIKYFETLLLLIWAKLIQASKTQKVIVLMNYILIILRHFIKL